jgi:hypothetical protein
VRHRWNQGNNSQTTVFTRGWWGGGALVQTRRRGRCVTARSWSGGVAGGQGRQRCTQVAREGRGRKHEKRVLRRCLMAGGARSQMKGGGQCDAPCAGRGGGGPVRTTQRKQGGGRGVGYHTRGRGSRLLGRRRPVILGLAQNIGLFFDFYF